MPHVITRIDGWELGTIIAKTADSSTGVPTVQTGTVRTGTYALQLLQNGVSPQALVYALTFTDTPAPGSGIPASTAFSAASFRAWVRFSVLPDSTRRILALRGVGPTDRTVISLSSTGVLSVDGNVSSYTLAVDTWYEITCLYDGGAGLVSLQVDDGTGRDLVFNNIAAASAGTAIQFSMGQTAALAVYTMFVDDIAIEATASVANIDFPAAGAVYGLPLSSNGLLSADVWGTFGAATRWECCTGPHDGDTTYIAVSNAGVRRQSFVQTIPAAVVEPINAVQFQQVVRKSAGLTGHLNRILIAATNTSVVGSFMELTANNGDGTNTYSITYRLKQLNPFTSLEWLRTDLEAMVVGTYADPLDLGGFQRVSTVMAQVDVGVAPSPDGGGSDVPSGSDIIPAEAEDAYCVSVIYDRGGPNETDLSSRLQSTRPLRQEKDVLLRQYRASDTELTFADTDGIFVEINPGTFLTGTDGRINWLGKPVDVFITQGADTLVRYRGFVINVQAGRGTGTLALGNRFQRIFDRIAFANSMGRVVSTTQAPGMGDAFFGDLLAPSSGSWLTRVTLNFQSPFDSNQAPFVETLRFSFLSGGVTAQFSCTGSLTGPKGFGSVDQPFTATDGSFSINAPTDWENEGIIAAGQECSLALVWRPTAGTSIIDSLLEFLTDAHTCAIDIGDIDTDSFDSFRGTIADQPVALVVPPVPSVPKSRLVVDTSDPLLRYLLEFALHLGCALIERADGRFALNSLVPRAYDLGEIPVLCKSDDLMAIAIDHLDVYNVYNFEYNRSETLDRYQSGGRWPPTFNESFDKYGRLLPAPNAMSFRGYDEGARSWIEIIAQSIFIRYQDPARIYSGKSKISRMDADLDTVYRIDSEGPTFEGPIVEPFVIQRNATGDLTVDTDLLEVRVLTEECGDFLWYDNEIMGYDDECWGYF